MYRIILPVVLGLFRVLEANKPSPKLCVKASKECSNDVFMCGLAYRRFEWACGLLAQPMSTRSNQNWSNLVPPTRKPCSHECITAIRKLKRTKRGKELHECDCQLDGDCLVVKARVANCMNRTRNREAYISCTVALWNCTMDPTCNSLRSKFFDDCGEMINGVRCEKKCMKIQEKLQRSKYGKVLSHCECDGPGEAYCRAIRAHNKQLRCGPEQDGLGRPNFIYVNDSEIFDFTGKKTGNNTAAFQSLSWTLLVLVLTLLLL